MTSVDFFMTFSTIIYPFVSSTLTNLFLHISLALHSVIFTYLFLITVLVYLHKAGRCGYALLLTATFWCLDVLPLAVTSLIPVVILPVMGLLTTKEVCAIYFKVSTHTIIQTGLKSS